MIIDTHCHYNLEPLYPDWRARWQKAREHGVQRSVVIGTNPETSERAVAIAKQDQNLYATLGVHPSEYQEDLSRDIKRDIAQLKKAYDPDRVVGIGETGLDYFRLLTNSDQGRRAKERQRQAFVAHIALAAELSLPLIIHVRDTAEAIAQSTNAYYDTLEILTQHHAGKQPFILHCVSGPLDYIAKALRMGAYLGIAANVTYPKSDSIREMVKMAPPDRLLSETDAPFLPPQPFRGQHCEPWMISQTVAYIEQELGIKPTQLSNNAFRLLPSLMLQ